ncbi:hypothetical protein [Streptomyces peucetius]|nr:hypothetical protein CGZ69_09940 [Streptomyces peucetius subsp. caesius ATCC 27952]
MAELAWITLGKHPELGLTASTVHDDFGSAHRLLLDAGFSTGHPDFAYVVGDSRPDEVRATLQQLYRAVASYHVAIDDASLDGPMPTSPAPPRGSEPAHPLAPSPRRPDLRADLAEFAEELSGRLPGSWSAAVHEHAAEEGQIPLNERVWDYGHVSWALSEFTPHRSAVLISDSGIALLVTDRPLRKHEFLVAAFEPRGSGFDTATKTPNGIVVSNDPARAASRVANRLLPRYQKAVREVRLSEVAKSVAAGQRVLAEWDAVSDSLCDADHWPLDERYGLRQQVRDAEMWAQFAPFLEHGQALVRTPRKRFLSLTPQSVWPGAGRTGSVPCVRNWTAAPGCRPSSRWSPRRSCPTILARRRSSRTPWPCATPRAGTTP